MESTHPPDIDDCRIADGTAERTAEEYELDFSTTEGRRFRCTIPEIYLDVRTPLDLPVGGKYDLSGYEFLLHDDELWLRETPEQ